MAVLCCWCWVVRFLEKYKGRHCSTEREGGRFTCYWPLPLSLPLLGGRYKSVHFSGSSFKSEVQTPFLISVFLLKNARSLLVYVCVGVGGDAGTERVVEPRLHVRSTYIRECRFTYTLV